MGNTSLLRISIRGKFTDLLQSSIQLFANSTSHVSPKKLVNLSLESGCWRNSSKLVLISDSTLVKISLLPSKFLSIKLETKL